MSMKSEILAAILCAAAAFLLAGCVKDKVQLEYTTDDRAINIVPEISSGYTSKSNPVTPEKETEFNKGDMIALLCADGHTTFKLGNNGWKPTDNYYLRWGNSPVTYSAFYPATESSKTFGNFDLPSSQRTAELLAAADYMTCTVTDAVKPADGKLHLEMKRQMARVRFTLSGVESGARVQGFRVWTSTGFTEGAANPERMYVSPYTVAREGSSSGLDGTVYTAIILPSEADASKVFVSLNYKSKDIELSGVPSLEAGCNYDIPVNISGSVISLGVPTVSPWDDAVTVIGGGDAEKVPLVPYFVKPSASGTADGLSWENAFGMTEFLNLIKQKNDTQAQSDENADNVDDRDFYFAGGTYSASPVKVEYGGHATRVKFRVHGGYSASSTGTDITSRDISSNETVFDGNGLYKFLILGNQTELTFDGVVFANLLSDSNGCIQVAAGGSGDARADFTDCTFRSCKSSTGTIPVLLVDKGLVRLSHVSFTSCRAEGGPRGLIRLRNVASRVYLNACTFSGNTFGGGGFGQLAHINEKGGILCMYNVTYAGNDTGCTTNGVVNGSGGMLISSSTLAASNSNPVIRCESDPTSGSVLVNNLLIQEKDQKAIDMSSTGKKLSSKGGNVTVGSINDNSQYEASTSDDSFTSLSDASELSLSWNGTSKCYLWNGTTTFTKLTATQIRAAISGYSNSATGTVKAGDTAVYDGSKAGEDFLGWLDSIGAFGYDGFGNARSASAHCPGAYQAD